MRSRLRSLALILRLKLRKVKLVVISIKGVLEFLRRWRSLKPVHLFKVFLQLDGVSE